MKPFDVYLRRAQDPEWSPHYVDYASLKKTLRMFGKRRRKLQRGDLKWSTVLEEEPHAGGNQSYNHPDANGSDNDNNIIFGYTLQDISSMGMNGNDTNESRLRGCGGVFGGETKTERLSRIEHDDFKKALQAELDQASRWFQTCWIELQSSAAFTESNDETEEENTILKLYGFAVVNICVLRQLLLRYNAHVRMYDGSMFLSEYEILQPPQSGNESSSLMVSEAEYERATDDFSLKTVVPSLLASLEPLQDRMMTLPSYWMDDSSVLKNVHQGGTPSSAKPAGTDPSSSTFRARADELEALLDKTSWKQQTRQSPNKTERILQTIRYFYTMGTAQMGISMEPRFLFSQVRGFKKEMKALALWRERPLDVADGIAYGDEGDEAIGAGMDPANVWPLVLNLISCYLFMMNNYIIEPSSAYYANALGSSDALSGIMMGMAPWFALTSAVGYSIWTNTSYKQPILFSGVLMVVGNTLYGAAYSQQSMVMCLVGRGISGFGAPRIINRRYVADATPFSLRTMSSAAFALTTALGAASGPGFAILLDMVPEFEFSLPFLGVQTFNGMTGPGFFMAVFWFFFTVLIVLTFREPNRSGLEELRQREAAAAKKKAAEDDASAALRESFDGEGDRSFRDGAVTDDDDDDASSVGSLSVGSAMDESGVSKHSPLYCVRNMTRATALCMALIFMKRIALESIVGSTSVITKNRYAWSIRNVGVLHLVNGIIVIPVSIFAGWLSQYREDRYLAMWFMGITSLGLLAMVDLTDLVDTETSDSYNDHIPLSVGPVQYIAGSLVAFSGIEACESFVASLMSKCVPSALAVGTFNSGLLATLVGTGGRAVGDLFITAMGLISIRNLLNLLIIPGLALMILSMFLLWRNYTIVAV
ncbi:unnamed protein product [Pseudo-nitzschia multistriata]|uniref:SPX domain-containing protein n=1 Tax=Pseudo-nitzschia multistriata TaxID=183589 RepID=A0A448ZF54_9STRA|nr:unnamed protein product [Pseudo-nitzschia multistriata]